MLNDYIYRKKNFTTKNNKIILLLHGFMGSSEIWKFIYKDFSKEYKILSIDFPGHGKSHFNKKYKVLTMDHLSKIVIRILKEENVKKMIIIGHSMGGYVSLHIAEKIPSLISGICLLHSTSKPDTIEKKKKRIKLINLVKKNYPLFLSKTVVKWFNEKDCVKDKINFAKKIAISTSIHSIIALLKGMILRKDKSFLLKRNIFPILHIFGKYDNILNKEDILEEKKIGFNVDLKEIPTGHMSHLENPNMLITILKKFIKNKINE